MSPVPAGPYYPTSPLVAVAWLGQRVAGLAPGMVATRLPRDLSTWADLGFVQATVVTGTPDVDVPIRRPLVQVDAWAHSPDGVKPPVNKAARLAELVRVATEDGAQYGKPVAMPAKSVRPSAMRTLFMLRIPSGRRGGFLAAIVHAFRGRSKKLTAPSPFA